MDLLGNRRQQVQIHDGTEDGSTINDVCVAALPTGKYMGVY
jgi:hypothetical protein